MKISTRSRYGLRLMLSLAVNYGTGPIFLKGIAEQESISEKYLGQIVIALKAGGLIKSFRGAHGGYALARPPDKFTLKEVIEALEGDLSLVECVQSRKACLRISSCVTHEVWRRMTEAISSTLQSLTLQDLVDMYRRKADESADEQMYYI